MSSGERSVIARRFSSVGGMACEHAEPLSPNFRKGEHGRRKKMPRELHGSVWSIFCSCFSRSSMTVVLFTQKTRAITSMAKHTPSPKRVVFINLPELAYALPKHALKLRSLSKL